MRELPERRESLWLLILGPLIWSAHFLLSYITAAVWCAKVAGRTGSLSCARLAIAVFTLLALSGIGLTAWGAWRRHKYGRATVPHDLNTAADRHRFLGFATLLLCGLSFVGTAYVALGIVFFQSCE
ncbi:hypothetical protein F6455_03635 [Proteobacteria bacterium 005FR1]|nr:hypothetical protein [Proteobacteria bacterium 005FR1]